MPTIKQHSSRSVPRQTAEGTISSLNDKDENPPISNSLREDQNASIKTNQAATYPVMQSVPSPDEDQQYSGRNVVIHIYVTLS